MQCKVTVFNVGHGDAILLDWLGPHGERWTCLVDGGKEPKRLREYLRAAAVSRLDLVVGTHPDSDHVGGLCGLEGGDTEVVEYWGPPVPAFERHKWLFGERGRLAIERCRKAEASLKAAGAKVLYPLENYNSAPFGLLGPQVQVLSPPAKLVRTLLTSDDVGWLVTSEHTPLAWLLNPVEPDGEETREVMALDRALSTFALDPRDLENWFPPSSGSVPTVEAEFFGNRLLNNTSIVLWIEVPFGSRRYSLLLTGDQENWTYLLARNPRGLNADILKAPHHGGRIFLESDLAHEEVISHVRPKAVLMSGNGQHKLPRSNTREAAIRWGGAVFCTSERKQEFIVGVPTADDCCHLEMGCNSKGSANITLIVDENGIRSQSRACHSGQPTLAGPVIQVRQHIVNPSGITDRLAEHELRNHISWTKAKLIEIHQHHLARVKPFQTGTKTLEQGQLLKAASAAGRLAMESNLSLILARGNDRREFWARQNNSYDREWRVYCWPSDGAKKELVKRIREKIVIVFPHANDLINRGPTALLTSLNPEGLRLMVDALYHFPQDIFDDTFWPELIAEFENNWHCFARRGAILLSKRDQSELMIRDILSSLRVEKEVDPWGDSCLFFLDKENLPFDAPILIGGALEHSFKDPIYGFPDYAQRARDLVFGYFYGMDKRPGLMAKISKIDDSDGNSVEDYLEKNLSLIAPCNLTELEMLW